MTGIESIAVTTEDTPALTGNVLPLLHELRHALQRFLESGQEHVIDLTSLPMAPQEEQQLEQLLGDGEVHARLDALGRSEIAETAVPGIWRITHFNGDDAVVGRFLEVTDCPAIFKSQQEDLPGAVSRLQQLIDELD